MWGAHPAGDRVLFESHGNALALSVGSLLFGLTENDYGAGLALSLTPILALAAACILHIPFAHLLLRLGALSQARDSTEQPRAAALVSPLLAISALQTLGLVACIGGGLGATGAVASAVEASSHANCAAAATAACIAAFAVVGVGVAAFGDLTRATLTIGIVHRSSHASQLSHGFLRALYVSLRDVFRLSFKTKLHALGTWIVQSSIGVGFIIAASRISQHAFASNRLFLLACVHQLVVVVRLGLRASWLALVMRRVAASSHHTGSSEQVP